MDAIKNFDQLPDSALVRMPVVMAIMGGASRQTVERWIREDIFPRGVAVTEGFRAWQVGELRQFLADKQAAGAPLSVRSPGGRKGNRSMAAA
jgi:predicted DNA-binding transcriptional regulator AlpA